MFARPAQPAELFAPAEDLIGPLAHLLAGPVAEVPSCPDIQAVDVPSFHRGHVGLDPVLPAKPDDVAAVVALVR